MSLNNFKSWTVIGARLIVHYSDLSHWTEDFPTAVCFTTLLYHNTRKHHVWACEVFGEWNGVKWIFQKLFIFMSSLSTALHFILTVSLLIRSVSFYIWIKASVLEISSS